jgi:hypothetical protein
MADSYKSFVRYTTQLQEDTYRQKVIDLFMDGHAPIDIARTLHPQLGVSEKSLRTPVTWALRGNAKLGITGLVYAQRYEDHLATIVSAQKSRISAERVGNGTHQFCDPAFGRRAAHIKHYGLNQ